MAGETKRVPINMLTAEELIENKGLKYNALNEYETSAKSLPKTGMKQFEPNDSWLQRVQIEKGIETRKNLIAIERVDRISQLASAEWLPDQRRARVKKLSGQDWGSFGLEKNGALYLIPEEALFLLEANRLELTWNNVPVSIQQAYELLIDDAECSLEEYRVYSQLVRHGYRIQRFIYNAGKNGKREETGTRRKVIVEPENGLRMSDVHQQNKCCSNVHEELPRHSKNADTVDSSKQTSEDTTEDKTVPKIVHEVMNDLLGAVEEIEDPVAVEPNGDRKKRKSKVEIISNEIILGDIKIVTNHTNNSVKDSSASTSWQASRIQRNVKLVPKRTDKRLSINDAFESKKSPNKRKLNPSDENNAKKSKQEVIELSDDEIQEVSKPMTRMDLLSLIPNIASQLTVTVNISRGYIPHSIKPNKTVYHYVGNKLKGLPERHKRFQSDRNTEHENNNRAAHHGNHDSTNRRNTVTQFNPYQAFDVRNLRAHDYVSMQHFKQHTNFAPTCAYNNGRGQQAYVQDPYWIHRNSTFENMVVPYGNHCAAVPQNRCISVPVQIHNLLRPNVHDGMIRSCSTRQPVVHEMFRKLYHQRIVQDSSVDRGAPRNALLPTPRRWHPPRYHKNQCTPLNYKHVYPSSFKVIPGASSWPELKLKWREEKTITIDDEDTNQETDKKSNEVQVVGQTCSPLVGPKNANSLEEVFSKLRIIKSAPEKIVRKKSKRKISYNVYSNTQSYRKANPGLPCYRIVVVRPNDSFIQPIELYRLMHDAENSLIVLACVSQSISYIQPGFISLPNLT
ncbi:uncharacterized protein LOC108629051 [Ceratina calcarata]|uniref:Uncharacterized protein LOC108629051 n=1 Tax=Ceratina calcarata TaxID=156304 RepID=A0AAJ7J8U9_9HYME|nr:uncharacterized protein LOC108629051 [Ceratina calcarata]